MNIVYNCVLSVSMVIVIYLTAYVLVKYDSTKKVWYIAALSSVFLFLLGELLGKLSTTAEGAFMGTKVEYIGSASLTPAIFLFVADFCGMRLRRLLKILLWITPIAVIVLLWTTEYHGLIYAVIDFAQEGIHRLRMTPGPLHLVIHIFSLFCAVLSLALLTRRFFNGGWGAVRRFNLFMLFLGIFIPVTANVMYVFKVISFNATPVLLTIACVLFYFNTIKFNMLDILPLAEKRALHSIKEAFLLVDGHNNFIHANEAGKKLFGQLAAMRIGQSMHEVEGWLFYDIEKIDISEPIPFEMPGDYHFIANISVILDERSAALLGYIVLIQDVTEFVLLNKKLEEMAHTDALTGILNRRQFMNLASRELERAARTDTDSYFVLFDIDHFKKINDTHGHLVGDRVLHCLAERVNRTIRPYDLFGRYGGEEFILYISGISRKDIIKHTERVRLALCETPMEFDDLGISLTVSASFGIAQITMADTIEGIINLADGALYRAKVGGRNRSAMAQGPLPEGIVIA